MSTCNRRATALYFCSVPCWDAHVPEARHRDAWAEVETAPTRQAWLKHGPTDTTSTRNSTPDQAVRIVEGARRIVSGNAPRTPASSVGAADDVETDEAQELPHDVLVVVSKLKAYVRAKSSMNTSDGVVDVLSDHLRSLCGAAIRSAAANSRKTVLARDFAAVLNGQRAASD